MSRITGTLGKGIAALTMDDEYQQSRRTNMSKKPTSVKEGLSRGGKGLLEVRTEINITLLIFVVEKCACL